MTDTGQGRIYLAFDIEIARLLPSGAQDWKSFRPLGITCAATLADGEEPRLWHGLALDDKPADQMGRSDLGRMLGYLVEKSQAGYTILTWNGLGFDFDILAEESGEQETCQTLALGHVDMMFHIFCVKGFPLGLDTAAKGMGLPGKTAGMAGDLAPKYWAQGRREEVLEYVAQDSRTTLDLARAAERGAGLQWKSRRGLPQLIPLPRGWLTVREALHLPLPDTSWMTNPMHRSRFTDWLKD
jgi:RNase_H superfamily